MNIPHNVSGTITLHPVIVASSSDTEARKEGDRYCQTFFHRVTEVTIKVARNLVLYMCDLYV